MTRAHGREITVEAMGVLLTRRMETSQPIAADERFDGGSDHERHLNIVLDIPEGVSQLWGPCTVGRQLCFSCCVVCELNDTHDD